MSDLERVTNAMIIGHNIKLIRENNGISQAMLARKLGITPASLSYYEKGVRPIPVTYLVDIARMFNVSLDRICITPIVKVDDEFKQISFEHFRYDHNGYFISDQKSIISNPYSMYFTLENRNGDIFVFMRTSNIVEGLMLVEQFDGRKVLIKFTKVNSPLFNKDKKDHFFTYVNNADETKTLTDFSMFAYLGVLVAKIEKIAQTDEFFAIK